MIELHAVSTPIRCYGCECYTRGVEIEMVRGTIYLCLKCLLELRAILDGSLITDERAELHYYSKPAAGKRTSDEH